MGHELKDGTVTVGSLSGDECRGEPSRDVTISGVPWLDSRSSALVLAIADAVAAHPEVRAVILFGSVARHEERPLEDDEPSDVDLLILAEPRVGRSRLTVEQQRAIYGTVGRIRRECGDTPREVQVTLTEADLTDWDVTFVENVAHDGIVLWAYGPLPASLAGLAARGGYAVPSLPQG